MPTIDSRDISSAPENYDIKGRDQWSQTIRTLLRGAGQVMFQRSAWTGLFVVLGIFWGAYEMGMIYVAVGAMIGLISANIAGFIVRENLTDCDNGLWGFNGILVGCAFPLFLGNTWQMWLALLLCAMFTTWVRTGMNNVLVPWKSNSLTFPFVVLTWVFLLASRSLIDIAPDPLSMPDKFEFLDTNYPQMSLPWLAIAWLKGISQVFLIDSWVTGILILIGLALCSKRAAIWASIGSAVGMCVAIGWGANTTLVAEGLYGFCPVLTAIALGCTFYTPNRRTILWALTGAVVTVFVQAAMISLLMPLGLPTLTAPFCVVTWMMLLPQYKLDGHDHSDNTQWKGNSRSPSKSDSAIRKEIDRMLGKIRDLE